MHIHGNPMGIQAAGFYSAAQGEKTAAEVRKRLLKRASSIESAAKPEETPSFGQWLDLQHSRLTNEDEYHPAASGKNFDFS